MYFFIMIIIMGVTNLAYAADNITPVLSPRGTTASECTLQRRLSQQAAMIATLSEKVLTLHSQIDELRKEVREMRLQQNRKEVQKEYSAIPSSHLASPRPSITTGAPAAVRNSSLYSSSVVYHDLSWQPCFSSGFLK